MSTPDDAPLSGPSAQLLRAVGDLQLAPLHEDPTAAVQGIGLIGDMDALALASGLAYSAIPPLLEAGIAAGSIARGAAGGVGSTKRGWRWHRWDQEHHHR